MLSWYDITLGDVGSFIANKKYDNILVKKNNQWYIWTRHDTFILAEDEQDKEEYHYIEDEPTITLSKELRVIGFADYTKTFYIKVEG